VAARAGAERASEMRYRLGEGAGMGVMGGEEGKEDAGRAPMMQAPRPAWTEMKVPWLYRPCETMPTR
jgi:hypothetical protein